MTSDNLISYNNRLHYALKDVSVQEWENAFNTLRKAIECKQRIFLIGNGGSAAIANHFATDFMKGIATDTWVKPKVISLASNVPLITAIGNDIGFEQIFKYQLDSLSQVDDVLISISSSGNSPNIVQAIGWAKKNYMTTISLSGFDPENNANSLADIKLHVPVKNYGIVEDAHSAILHSLSQSLRKEFAIDKDASKDFTF
ncbi:phosphoheptose isomerase [Caulobacter phage Cr30]|uniref:phosphoheptose isomerase n=1 Tax=Caulobacter phage Cr30 TaxID=1357714 RepID=UPI0004A9B698|nr:phosphoheptose isomerase [Caulobacter phage Cr30]AGS80891.1 phosphoheptose isomerase [Caulobacter phage Cr30]